MDSNEIILAIVCTTLFILLLIAVIVIVFFVSGRQKVQQASVLAETKLSFERELRQVEAEVSEQVMGQFARELHDNIGQLLTAMHIQLENQKIDHPELTEGFRPVDIYLDEVTQQLRMLSRTLNNDFIGHTGLLGAIQLEADRLRALRRFTVHYSPVAGSSNLDKNEELVVFRIFQEIVQNALRHASAQNFYITINNSNGAFELKVEDDGKGCFIEEILQSRKASGLKNILRRAALAGMDCQVKSAPGKGCLFTLKKIMH